MAALMFKGDKYLIWRQKIHTPLFFYYFLLTYLSGLMNAGKFTTQDVRNSQHLFRLEKR